MCQLSEVNVSKTKDALYKEKNYLFEIKEKEKTIPKETVP